MTEPVAPIGYAWSIEVAEWCDSIGAEENMQGRDECPGCDGGPCVWATNFYPQQETA